MSFKIEVLYYVYQIRHHNSGRNIALHIFNFRQNWIFLKIKLLVYFVEEIRSAYD